jgi:hypothetical protein
LIFAFSNFETTFAQLLASLRHEVSAVGWMFINAGALGAVVQGGWSPPGTRFGRRG